VTFDRTIPARRGILRGLPSGPHKVTVELVDANHQAVDKGTIEFEVPKGVAAATRSEGKR
jgi:hypothetical protein